MPMFYLSDIMNRYIFTLDFNILHYTVFGFLIISILLLLRISRIAEPIFKHINGKIQITNWGRCQTWTPSEIFRPKSLEDLLDFMKTYKQKGIKRLRPFGALHSWSSCAATTGVNIDMRGLDNVIEVNKEKLFVKAQAGIQLKALYKVLRENKIAIPTMPNVDIITLGGALSNGTHGTNIKNGSFPSLVEEIELIDHTGKMWTLTRESKDPTLSRYFDAALISFGSLGIIYSITLRCVEDYNMIQIMNRDTQESLKGRIVELSNNYDSVLYCMTRTGDCMTKISLKVPVLGTSNVAVSKLTSIVPIYKGLVVAFYFVCNYIGALHKFSQRMMVKSFNNVKCLNWDIYEILPHTIPFINMEYAIPEEKIEEAVKFVTEFFKVKKDYNRKGVWVIRPVGSDDRGFLSSTRNNSGKPTFYVDIPYDNKATGDEIAVYKEIEDGLIKLGGRCSFSRLFWNVSPKILDNFWDKGGVQWKKVKLELDPDHVFTNEFVNKIFFDSKVKLG